MRQGFTLIELLVVIAIIGMLSSIVLASVNTARAKARDTARIAGLQEMRSALELYYSVNNSYPNVLAYLTLSSGDIGWSALGGALQPHLSKVPMDYPANGFLYSATNGGQKYGLAVGLDSEQYNDLMANDGGHFPAYYELGPSPAECHAAVPTPKDWWGNTNINCP